LWKVSINLSLKIPLEQKVSRPGGKLRGRIGCWSAFSSFSLACRPSIICTNSFFCLLLFSILRCLCSRDSFEDECLMIRT